MQILNSNSTSIISFHFFLHQLQVYFIFSESKCLKLHINFKMDAHSQRKSSENSFNSYKEDIICESDLPAILLSCEAQACQCIEDRNYTAALMSLKRSEEIMEAVATQGGATDPDQMMTTINNIAVCYQQ